MQQCEYCRKNQDPTPYCKHCGAPMPSGGSKAEPEGYHFYLNGYVVWVLRDFAMNAREFYFYRGDRIVEHFKIEEDVLREWIPPEVSSTDFIWNLFLVAQGEMEVYTLTEKDAKYPATFEVRRIENPQKEFWRSMSYRDMLTVTRL